MKYYVELTQQIYDPEDPRTFLSLFVLNVTPLAHYWTYQLEHAAKFCFCSFVHQYVCFVFLYLCLIVMFA